MPRLLLILLSMLFANVSSDAASSSADSASRGQWTMHWRVFCDPEAGVSFRYPYDFYPKEQYSGDLADQRKQLRIPATASQDDIKKLVEESRANATVGPDIHEFSLPISGAGADATMASVGDKQADEKLEWKPFDYYANPSDRAFADPKWAVEGIEAVIGSAAKRCGIVVKHGERFSGVILAGDLTKGENQQILNTFEVLSTGKKPKKDEKPEKNARVMTWREAQGRLGKILDGNGKLTVPKKDAPVSWASAWEMETQHYHVTTNHSSMILPQHAQYLEGLFRAYTKLYEPNAMPPYKFEVHVFSTYKEFLAAAPAWNIPINVRPGDIMGGFFVPSLLSLWVYEESGKLAPDMAIDHVMAHECSHQFLHVTCNGSDHIPTWMNEGLAVYFESGIFQNGEFVVKSPVGRINQLKAAYASTNATLNPLDTYLDHHGNIPGAVYGEVFAMTSFWVFGTCEDRCTHAHKEGRPDCGRLRFREYFEALKKKEDGNEAFERIFMGDMIKAKGTREKAVEFWQKSLLEYTKTRLK